MLGSQYFNCWILEGLILSFNLVARALVSAIAPACEPLVFLLHTTSE